jgi:hypothetical protein
MTIKTIRDYENICGLYVYRGQSNTDWQLLPGAYRCDSSVKSIKIEKESVDRFIRHLWEYGYNYFPSELSQSDFITQYTAIFPTEELLPFLALAQHYAFDSQFRWLKTSLLDVTHNLDIAAYFAVEKEAQNAADGKIFIFDPATIQKPYKLYEPRGGSRMEARLVVQDCAFIYREQVCEYEAYEYNSYKNAEPFNDIVKDTIIIPSALKSQLKEHLQKKLFNLFIYPRLILGQVTSNSAIAFFHSCEALKEIHKPEVERAKKLANKHSVY